jgi:hypothetical protein
MYITQCFYSEAGEKSYWHDLNKWLELKDARADLKECRRTAKKYKWRIIKRIETYSKKERVIK